jgi:hypothetical protein
MEMNLLPSASQLAARANIPGIPALPSSEAPRLRDNDENPVKRRFATLSRNRRLERR